ncbi:MAG: LacI family transcriptional regulator [Caldilineales bacterium]|nr:LacI family transcriptional regulator [Caldilineales bacterium]MDW8317221.1 LacI family DNA-binding transcriptional regulator [Anaerolineae bacterium]
MAVTIYDVAKQAGVGVGTVSRVLNGNPNVRPETRQRVLAVIEELNYHPSPIARRLSLRKTLTIGVIAPFFTRPSIVERLRGIEALVAESDYDLVVYNVETPERRDACFRSVVAGHRVDGLIVIHLAPTDDDVRRWAQAQTPVILVDTRHPALHRVVIDDVAGGHLATRHLIELGHRRIGYISDWLDEPFHFTSSRDRLLGYQRALAEAGLPFRPEYHRQGDHGREQARQMAHDLLRLAPRPTAIFAHSDTQALGVMQAAADLGLRVPEDLSVVGFDDIEMAEYAGLTTVRQPLAETGRKGIELLLRLMDDPSLPTACVELPIELVVRRTTAPPPNP